jgi:glycogen debranching enzyme
VDVDKVESPDERPTDEQYKRYAVLVKAIAADDFGPGPFAVYDPFMTAILIRADRDLRAVAGELGIPIGDVDRESRAQACLRRLWSSEQQRFEFHDAVADRRGCPEVLAAYLAATVIDDPSIASQGLAALDQRYQASCPLPTVSLQDPGFDPVRYWRGPCWISMNWLFATSGDRPAWSELTSRTIELVATRGCWEYFDPRSGKGLGADCFTWSAALALDLLERSSR